MDSGSHIVDIVCWMSQLKPVEVTAFVSNEFAREEEVDILSTLSVRFDNRALASICINGNAPWYERLILSGTKATVGFGAEKWMKLPNGEDAEFPEMPEPGNPDDNFIAVIQGKEEPLSTGRDALKVVQISQAAYLSEKEKRAVAIDEL
jgi:predicted dehydrogenase